MTTQPADGASRVRATSAADIVVADLTAAIQDGTLAVGQRVGTKAELCRRFGVAPATLGEALRVLRGQGKIEVKPGPGGGIFVARQAPLLRLANEVGRLRREGASVNDFVEVIDGLDESVMHQALVHRTEADVADLSAMRAELAEVWADPSAASQANWHLHRRFAQISPNPVLQTFYRNVVDYLLEETGDLSHEIDGFWANSPERLGVHQDLIDAVVTRDTDLLERALVAHRTSGTPARRRAAHRPETTDAS